MPSRAFILMLLGGVLVGPALAGCAPQVTPDSKASPAEGATTRRTVLVVDEHEVPVKDADVAFRADFGTDRESSDRYFEGAHDPSVDCELKFAGLPRYRSGPDGVARLPTGLAEAAVIARAGERFGAADLKFDDRAVVMPILRIAPDRHVKVLVRGPDGKPRSGVPIEVAAPASQWMEVRRRYRTEGTNERTEVMGTDDAGHLTIWHAQTLCTWDPALPRLRLRARVAGTDSKGAEVDLRQLPAGPVELPCPAFGNLVVHRWLAKGIPNGSSADLRVWTIAVGDESDPEITFGSPVDAESSVWRSRPVGIGQRYRVHADQVIEVDGPTRDGESIRVDLFEPGRNPALARVSATVALELPDGTPCANETVVLGTPTSKYAASVRTDARGRASFATQRGGWFPFHVPGRNLVADVRVPRPEHRDSTLAEILDLGTLRLRAARLVVSGRLIDATTKEPVWGTIDVKEGFYGHAHEWPAEPDGTFNIWDDPRSTNFEPGQCTLVASPGNRRHGGHQSYEPVTRSIAFGVSNLVIELARTRLLRCVLLVDPEIDASTLTLRVQDGEGWRGVLELSRQRSGRQEWHLAIPNGDPAAWGLSIAGGLELPPLHTVPGSAFQATSDGYEVEVDLRGKLAEFDVFCPQMSSFYGADSESQLFVRRSGSTDPWRAEHLYRVTTVVAQAGTRLEAIACTHTRPIVRVVLSPGLTEVSLPPRLAIEIDVQAPPVPEGRLRAYLVPLEPTESWIEEARRHGLSDKEVERSYQWPRDAGLIETRVQEQLGTPWVGSALKPGRQRVEVPRRGSYVLLPFVWTGGDEKLLPEAAVVCTAENPGEVVQVTLRLDPEKLRVLLSGK